MKLFVLEAFKQVQIPLNKLLEVSDQRKVRSVQTPAG